MPFEKGHKGYTNKNVEAKGTIEVPTSDGKTQQVELVIKREPVRNYKKKEGSDIRNAGSAITFLSTKRSLQLFKDDTEYIIFKNSSFTTDNPSTIEWLREHELFNIEIFEGDYPKDVQKFLDDEKRYLTKDKHEHEA